MKKAALVFVALVVMGGACDLDSDGGNQRSGGFGTGSLGRGGAGVRQARIERRIEARRERLQERRRLARLERRRQARLAAQRERQRQRRQQAAEAAAAIAETEESCTDGYDPCLPPAADYDCENGTGDGPAYTGYVTVTGSDPYGLDSDGDGAGCES
jgi:hypothetical protein